MGRDLPQISEFVGVQRCVPRHRPPREKYEYQRDPDRRHDRLRLGLDRLLKVRKGWVLFRHPDCHEIEDSFSENHSRKRVANVAEVIALRRREVVRAEAHRREASDSFGHATLRGDSVQDIVVRLEL